MTEHIGQDMMVAARLGAFADRRSLTVEEYGDVIAVASPQFPAEVTGAYGLIRSNHVECRLSDIVAMLDYHTHAADLIDRLYGVLDRLKGTVGIADEELEGLS